MWPGFLVLLLSLVASMRPRKDKFFPLTYYLASQVAHIPLSELVHCCSGEEAGRKWWSI